jgi:type II secretory pathway component PulK
MPLIKGLPITDYQLPITKMRGSVLMITLWILAILVIFSLGLAHRATINLRLSRYQRDRQKALYLAKAGINKAISLLRQDALDPETKDYDTNEACGVSLKGASAESLFSQDLGKNKGSFKLGYLLSKKEFHYGLRDEESRININGIIGVDNKVLLSELFRFKEIVDYDKIADTVVNWIDSDKEAEAFYKNEKLVVGEELLLILEYFYSQSSLDIKDSQSKAQEAYNKVRDLITVYGSAKINVNTASEDVLKIISRAIAKSNGKPEAAADNLASRLAAMRGNPFKNQAAVNSAEIGDAQEKEIFTLMAPYLVPDSDCFRIEASGSSGSLSKTVVCVYSRSGKKALYWHEN